MTSITTFEELLYHLVDAGFNINLRKGDGCFGYEIQTGAKSNLTIFQDTSNLCKCVGRYDTELCEDYSDFLYTLKNCMCGRDWANGTFFDFLEKEGMITKKVKTTVSYD